MTHASLPPRVLSLQSHVVSGYVGNKAAVFPLQLLGFDVDILPSVTLSNHTAYAHGAPGPRHTASELSVWLEGLRANALLPAVTHLLTGYIGTSGTLRAVVDAVRLLREAAPRELVYVCDPVMGDDGKLYVSEDVVQVYVDEVLPLATLVTPNVFELGLLTGVVVHSEVEAFAACDQLHDKYKIPVVAVTGARFAGGGDRVAVLVSTREGKGEGKGECKSETETESKSESKRGIGGGKRFVVESEYFETSFTGTGDLMTAMLLAWTTRLPGDLEAACKNATATVAGVIRKTLALPKSGGLCEKPELRLIQSQDEILTPQVEHVTMRKAVS